MISESTHMRLDLARRLRDERNRNMTRHTPTPWSVAERDSRDSTLTIKGAGTRGNYVASVSPRPHYANDQEANAAFIVRAVNSHAALVESLETLFKHCVMTHKHWGEGCNQKEADAAQHKARAALKLAKET